MDNASEQLSKQKTMYREIFLKSAQEINYRIAKIKPNEVDGELFDSYTSDSDGRMWQIEVQKLLKNDISAEIFRKLKEINAYREMFHCSGCATCCKLACSEFSPEQLREKAKKGDKFATQFLSIFIPYETTEEAQKVYPEYLELLKEKDCNDVYFYHCPKLTADNRCSDYENRPQICRDFPDNPLSILPASCGYRAWKDEINPVALMLHSMIEIVDFYLKKLDEVIK